MTAQNNRLTSAAWIFSPLLQPEEKKLPFSFPRPSFLRPPLAAVPDDAALFFLQFSVSGLTSATAELAREGVYALWLNGVRCPLPLSDATPFLNEGENTVVAAVSQAWLTDEKASLGADENEHFLVFHIDDADGTKTVDSHFNQFGSLPNAVRETELLRGRFAQHEPIADCGGITLFSRRFTASGVMKAVVEATALGLYDIWLNGKRVGEHDGGFDEFKPGRTDYRKRVHADRYDVTELLRDGENNMVVTVASGWWNGKIASHTYGDRPVAFLAELTLTDRDGEHRIPTDGTWKTAYGSSIRSADLWGGELYDARLPSPAALSLTPALIEWHNVGVETHDVAVTPFPCEHVRIRRSLTKTPVSVTVYDGAEDNGTAFGKIRVVRTVKVPFSLRKGEIAVVDFGQNMTGYPSLTVTADRGTAIELRTGEMCNDTGSVLHGNDGPAGSVYSNNLRSAKSKAYYIASGDGRESYHPTYTFFGYRYLAVSATEAITVHSLDSLAVGSDLRETMKIETSSSDVNRLLSNILWSQRSNYFSIPTDCPQRDERLGWTGDTQVFSRSAAYNADVRAFLRKWLADARDSQAPDGQYPDCVPRTNLFGEGAAGWGDAGVIVCHSLYEMYGDTDVIEEHYASMERYMAWVASRGLAGPKAVYCDWLAVDWTEGDYISKAYYAYDAHLMAVMSDAVGKPERAVHYRALENEIKADFQHSYCAPDGRLLPCRTTQTAYLLALHHRLLNPLGTADALARLKENLASNGGKLTTGFLGTPILCEVLAEYGETSAAYALLTKTERPSWLYAVRQGATTVWERWDSYTPEHGFLVYGMDSSFNHYSYGAIAEWIYRRVAGIRSCDEHPGFSHPILAPLPDTRDTPDRITWVRASFDSPVGVIESAWDTRDGYTYQLTLPCPSTFSLPHLTTGETFTVNGAVRRYDEYGGGTALLELPAGKYVIKETPPKETT